MSALTMARVDALSMRLLLPATWGTVVKREQLDQASTQRRAC